MIMHKSVLLKETSDVLHIKNSARYIDATLGAGGHTIEILKRGGRVLGIEADKKMIQVAKEKIEEACPAPKYEFGSQYILANDNFRNIASVAKENGFMGVSGILFDLGISSVHLDSDDRGFSFKDETAPLDMRLSTDIQMVKASDLLNSLSEKNLMDLFLEGMEYADARRLASKVIRSRAEKSISTVGDFLDITGREKRGKIHPATKAFMALRIAVNTEMDNLKMALPEAYSLLADGGVMAVISFHSGEDKVVKDLYRDSELVLPTEEEINENPRARSAKMRVIKKI